MVNINTLNCYNKEMDILRQHHISQMINNNNKMCFLFSTIDKLLNPTWSIPSELSFDKCNDFATYFQDKISSIRNNTLILHKCEWSLSVPSHRSAILFTPDEVVQQLKSSTCSLDPIPTKLFKCLFHWPDDLLHITNTSLQSGVSPLLSSVLFSRYWKKVV